MTRYCRRCRRLIRPGQASEIVSAQEAGSGAPVALYAHEKCPPEPASERQPAGARR